MRNWKKTRSKQTMSKLQELIKQHCPNGVEYKKLGELISIYTGVQFNKRDMNEQGMYPVINGGINPSGFVDNYNEEASTITVSQGGASAGYVAWQYQPFWAGAHCFVVKIISDKLLNRYLFFFLKNQEFLLQQMQHGAGIPALNRDRIRNLEIPVPPLEVQEEIVKILDRFSEYAAELQAELQARREQYEYYRDKLLSFNKIGGVLWLTMNEIGTFIRGNGLQKKDFTESGFPCIHYGQIHTHYGTFASETISFTSQKYAEQLKKAQYGDLIIATTSEDVDGCCKAVAWLGHSEVAISGDAYIFHHKQNPKYISYLFQTDLFANYKRTAYTGTKVIRVSSERMGKFALPIPPLAEQERIVGILDKFETLVNDLSEGLPSEIAAVGEQYEYYRNKLLTFPRA